MEEGQGGTEGRDLAGPPIGGYRLTTYVWDERKRLANLRTHGLDFAEVEAGFDFAGATIGPSHRGRLIATGVMGGRLVTLVFRRLGSEGVSLISLRPASRKERRRYEDA